ncbi:MAG: enoyl-CoA hydratase-related protein [Pseudomonadota bacterium]
MTEASIYSNKDGEIAEIILNRPAKRNALNREIWEAIPKLVHELEQDETVKVIILRGTEPKAFAAGADIAEFSTVHANPESAAAYDETINQAYDAVANASRPTIAMIQGVCFGVGCALALCCDLRYCDMTARFSIPPARLGLAYTLAETKRLVDVVGPSIAKEMLMGARVLDANEARAVGLVTRTFEPGDLVDEVYGFAREMCALSQYSIRAVKTVVEQILEGEVVDNAVTTNLALGAYQQDDYREGRDAFLEKRTAKFTYR